MAAAGDVLPAAVAAAGVAVRVDELAALKPKGSPLVGGADVVETTEAEEEEGEDVAEEECDEAPRVAVGVVRGRTSVKLAAEVDPAGMKLETASDDVELSASGGDDEGEREGAAAGEDAGMLNRANRRWRICSSVGHTHEQGTSRT